MDAYINETPKGTSLRQTASFEPSCMFVRRSVRPLRDCEKKIQKNKNKKLSKEKKSQSRYISRMRGGALIQPIAMEVCTSV
jgi:Mg2+ and Co2+ transporter CorA